MEKIPHLSISFFTIKYNALKAKVNLFNRVLVKPGVTCLFLFLTFSSYANSKPKNKIIIYPAPSGETLDQHYKVSVEGRNVAVYTAKIAALNNSDKQVDTAAFAYFDMQGKAMVSVSVADNITSVKILPAATGIAAVIHGNTVSFSVSSPKNLTIEINGEWLRSLHIFVNPIEINAPKANDPNVIYFGPGIHVISHLEVNDNKTIYVAGGAIVRAVIDSDEKYNINKKDKSHGYSPSIALLGRNITIRGRGIIDASVCPLHTRNLLFVHGKKINVEGIILRDASTWTVPIQKSDSVIIDNIKVFGFRDNSDGIDICNSQNVTVKNCFIRTWDDLVVVKAFKGQGDSKHIFVTKCVLWNELAHALSIGAELRDNVDDVAFTDCDVIHDTGREWSFRIYQCDAGYVSNVRFENLRVEEAHKFISLWIGKAVWSVDKEYGHIENVVFKNITAFGKPLTVELVGIDAQHGIKDITFQNILMNGNPLTQDEIKKTPFISNLIVK